jgi:ATP-dependent HslUV protease ATP-binding subunit HslU
MTKYTHSFTPRETVSELDRFIIGQHKAKRAVAIALRNRWRRQHVAPELRDEIAPKNIILIGPTGCGKTEIARRLAKLAQAPFVKVEATKFTEVGYVGRDVESMVRDLVEMSIKMVKEEAMEMVKIQAAEEAEESLLQLLLPQPDAKPQIGNLPFNMHFDSNNGATASPEDPQREDTLEKLREMLHNGDFADRDVEVTVAAGSGMPMIQMFGQTGVEDMAGSIQDALQAAMGGNKSKRRKVKVPEALELLTQEAAQRLIDMDQVQQDAIKRTEDTGIIFIDEIDKIAARDGGQGPDVSREGVQRDILPIVEGSSVATKYGHVKTDHVLFIAAGAFHMSKPSDLIPELQGRFPIRVELETLTQKDFERILTEPENSLTKQYHALLATEKLELRFLSEGIAAIAAMAAQANENQENIGARRLYTVMEHLLEEISFSAPDQSGVIVDVNRALVEERLMPILEQEDLSKYIL